VEKLGHLLQTKSLAIVLGLVAAMVLIALVRRYALKRQIDLFAMWGETRLVVYTAVTGALYFAVLVPFKWAVLVPGFTEIRPGAAVPIVLSFLFGPAAAWGGGIGNFIGDFFGMLGPGSLFGFFGNFLLAYAPYAIYRTFAGQRPPNEAGWTGPVAAAVGIVVGSFACGTFIAWGAHLTGLAPFRVLAPIISLNNTLVGLVIALPLMLLIYPRAAKWGMLYYEAMDPEIARPARTAKLGAALLIVGSLGGFLVGMAIESVDAPPPAEAVAAVAAAPTQPSATPQIDAAPPVATPSTPDPPAAASPWRVGLGVAPFILLLLIGILLL
jgi:energy-coupling factor transport system substrate-specific component